MTARQKISNKVHNEKGQALMLTLILLGVGGLIIAPLMGFMSTGLIVGQAFDEEMKEFYAADAGVELASWELILGGLPVLEGTLETLTPFTMNDKTVDVTIENIIDEPTYEITSTAGGTTIEAYITIVTIPEAFFDGPPHYEKDYLELGVEEEFPYDGCEDNLVNVYVRQYVEVGPEAEIEYGNVYARGDVTLGAGAEIEYGNVYARGDVTLGAGAEIYGNVYARGDVTLGAGAEIYGNVYARGDVTLGAGAEIDGDVFVTGTLTLSYGATIEYGNVYVSPGGSVYVYGVGELFPYDQLPCDNEAIEYGTIVWNHPWPWPLDERIEIVSWGIN